MNTQKQAEQIYDAISGQRFFDWHADGGAFADHIQGETDCKTKEEILEDIKRIFRLPLAE